MIHHFSPYTQQTQPSTCNVKYFQAKAGRIHGQQTCTTGHAKESLSGKRKMTLGGNGALHKATETARKGHCSGNLGDPLTHI